MKEREERNSMFSDASGISENI